MLNHEAQKRLFVFEGLDKVGKSTILSEVMDNLYNNHKIRVVQPSTWHTEDPLKELMYRSSSAWVKVMAATTCRRVVAENVVRQLNLDHVVLLDRWIPSTVAYNTHPDPEQKPSPEDVYDIHRRVLSDLGGDWLISPTTFYLYRDVPLEYLYKGDLMDSNLEIRGRANGHYQQMLQFGRMIYIDNNKPIEATVDQITNIILKQIGHPGG